MRGGIKALALLALCFTAMLSQGGCGDDEQDSRTEPAAAKEAPEPSPPKSSPSTQPKPSKPSGPQRAERDHSKAGQKKDVESTAAKGSVSSPEGSGSHRSKDETALPNDRPPANLTDEEACERDPASCSSEQPALDSSTPDSRRAQRRDTEAPGVPSDCHTRDCEKARAAED